MTTRRPLAIYYADGGDDYGTAYVPVTRSKTERGARRVLARALAEHWDSDAARYEYCGIVRMERLHDHHIDDRCPGTWCLGPECTYVDDEDPIHGPGCPLTTPCPRSLDVHHFEATA